MAAQSEWGRVDAEGTVFVRLPDGERAVGSWLAGSPEEGLAYYERRYEDLAAEVGLLERRVASDPGRAVQSAARLRENLAEAAVVGDLAALDGRLAAIVEKAAEKQAEAAAAKAEQRAQAVQAKEDLVSEVEQLADSTDWRGADEKLRTLVERWKSLPRLDRKRDDELWGRLSAARSTFQRRRRAHFAELDERRRTAQARKEQLIAEAEALSTSSDWGPTTTRFRELMTEWKAAGGARKNVEEELWTRFKRAQDEFFRRRSEARAERDAGQRQNLEAKQALLAEAEQIDPSRGLEDARRRLRDIQRRWDAVGHVPRDAMAGLDRRMAAVEDKVRAAANARWRPDPAQSHLVERLQESIGKLERRIARAREAGNEADAAEAEATLATQRTWLAQAQQPGR